MGDIVTELNARASLARVRRPAATARSDARYFEAAAIEIDRLRKVNASLSDAMMGLASSIFPKGAIVEFRIGQPFRIEHDGFEGEVRGFYVTREGKPGVVLQQHGTRVVHVYGTKWLRDAIKAEDA